MGVFSGFGTEFFSCVHNLFRARKEKEPLERNEDGAVATDDVASMRGQMLPKFTHVNWTQS
jgi:hypothetical protein